MKLNGCVHGMQILNGGAPCQQIDSEEEDEQEAEAEDDVSTRDTLHALSRHVALLLLCCAVLCCAVLCYAVPCCVVIPSAHGRMEFLLHSFAVRAKLAVYDPSPFLPWQIRIMSKVSI